MSVLKITDDSFNKDVMEARGTVLVDFWAEWCGPCRMLGPILEDLAKTDGLNATIAKLNIDENPETAAQLGVRSIPTLMIFKEGKMVSTKVGVQSKEALLEWIQSH